MKGIFAVGDHCSLHTPAVVEYFQGLPSAYLPFLTDPRAVSDLDDKPCGSATASMMKTAKQRLGGRLMSVNIGIQTTASGRAAIAALLQGAAVGPGSGADEAVASMAALRTEAGLAMPPVVRDAFAYFKQKHASDCAKEIGQAICDAA